MNREKIIKFGTYVYWENAWELTNDIDRLMGGGSYDDKSAYDKLLIKFVRRYYLDISWYLVCINERLSKSFILEFSDDILWRYVPLFHIRIEHKRNWATFL